MTQIPFIAGWEGAPLDSNRAPRYVRHRSSDSYLRIKGGQEQLLVEWDIALKDLKLLIRLDTNQDNQITWGELKAKRQDIAAHALSRLSITVDGQECELQLSYSRLRIPSLFG